MSSTRAAGGSPPPLATPRRGDDGTGVTGGAGIGVGGVNHENAGDAPQRLHGEADGDEKSNEKMTPAAEKRNVAADVIIVNDVNGEEKLRNTRSPGWKELINRFVLWLGKVLTRDETHASQALTYIGILLKHITEGISSGIPVKQRINIREK